MIGRPQQKNTTRGGVEREGGGAGRQTDTF
jgi:hypothetical protein